MKPKTETKTTIEEEKKKPYMSFSSGHVRGTIWEQIAKTAEGKEFVYFTAKIVKNYKDKSDEWQETNSYGKKDIPSLKIVTDAVFRFLYLNEAEE